MLGEEAAALVELTQTVLIVVAEVAAALGVDTELAALVEWAQELPEVPAEWLLPEEETVVMGELLLL
jgi:hypothetical protein